MDEIFKFAATFKEYPLLSSPPSFNSANVMEEVKRAIKAKASLEKTFPMLKGEEDKAKE